VASRRRAILEAMRSRLEAIDGTGVFNTNVAGAGGARISDMRPLSIAELPILLLAVRNESKSQPTQQDIEGRVSYVIYAVPQQRADSGPIPIVVDSLVEDVERVLLAARQEDPPLGELGVTDMDVESWDLFEIAEDQLIGAAITVSVRYRHDLENPSTYRGEA
jgi:hypothetical protein